MQLSLSDAKKLSNQFLKKLGFQEEEIEAITNHLIEAELCDKKTHGFLRLPAIKRLLSASKDKIEINQEKIDVIKETSNTFLIDGKKKIGLYVVNYAVEFGIKKCLKNGIVCGGVTNTSAFSGMIGYYARKVAEKDLIYIGFNNSSSATIPHGAIKRLWGTNPFTVGIPSNGLPVIYDTASTFITYGQVIKSDVENIKLQEGVALDSNGKPTVNPKDVLNGGGLLPIAGFKGSGMAFIVELLAGALTSSLVGEKIQGGWGSLFIIINPAMFRSIKEFKNDVTEAILELKRSPKTEDVKEIFYPGEKSGINLEQNKKIGQIEISNELKKIITEI